MALGKPLPAKKMITATNRRKRLARLEWIALIGLLLLAAWLRLGRTGTVEFKRDEATLSRLALDVGQAENWTWLGIGSSVGFPNAPINVYIFAIPYAISDNPLLATLFVGFLNIIAVALLWVFTRRYINPTAALIAGWLFAASPWGAIYARKIWAQDLLAPFVILTVFTGILGFLEGKRWAQLIHLPLLAITVQIHFGAVTLIPISIVLLLMGIRQWSRWFWAGIALAGLVSMPFLYGLYDAELLSVSAIRDSLDSGEERDRSLETTAFDHAWLVVSGRDVHALAGVGEFQNYLDTIPPVYDLFSLIPILTIVAVVVSGRIVYQQQRNVKLWWILLLWLILPVLGFSYTWAEPQPHYMLPMLPAAFVFVAMLLSQVQQWPIARGAMLIGLGVLVGLQAFVTIRLYDFLGDTYTAEAFGTPLSYQLPIRDTVLDQDPQRVIVVSNGNSTEFDQDPAVWSILLNRVPNVDFIAVGDWWLSPADEALFLLSQDAIQSDWDNRLTGMSTTFDLRPNEGSYALWQDVRVAMPTIDDSALGHYANGVELLDVSRDGDVLWVMWQLPNPTANVLPIAFVHGVDVSDQRIQQVDNPFVAEAYWVAGDQLLWRVQMPLSDVVSLRIGLYVLVGEAQFQNIPHVDTNGAYVDQWIALPLPEDS